MATLLYISTSLFGDQGKSTTLANNFVSQLKGNAEGLKVIHRDLFATPVPHLDMDAFSAFATPAADRTSEQQAAVEFSDLLINEIREADTLVIGLPMYNLGIPSVFKAYIDHVMRAGETFQYTEGGPKGLLKDRKVYIIAARGGLYSGSAFDTQTSYIHHIFAFMGITDVEFISAEGLNIDPDTSAKALADAKENLTQISQNFS